jgi:hypothetical protein
MPVLLVREDPANVWPTVSL